LLPETSIEPSIKMPFSPREDTSHEFVVLVYG